MFVLNLRLHGVDARLNQLQRKRRGRRDVRSHKLRVALNLTLEYKQRQRIISSTGTSTGTIPIGSSSSPQPIRIILSRQRDGADAIVCAELERLLVGVKAQLSRERGDRNAGKGRAHALEAAGAHLGEPAVHDAGLRERRERLREIKIEKIEK